MFNIPSFFGFRAGGQFDPDALAFFARVDAATATTNFLTSTEKFAVDTLVKKMKGDGIYSLMKAVYPMVGGGTGTLAQKQAACEQNLISSSFTGSFSSGWTFASTGVTPNGSSAFMDSNFNQSLNLTPSNNHISIYSRTNANGGTFPSALVDCGVTNNLTHSFTQIISRRLGNFEFENGSQTTSNAVADSLGLFLGSALSTGLKTYKNGSVVGTNTTLQARTMFSANIYFGATNDAIGGIARYFSNRQNSFASIGDGLTDTEASNFYNAVQTFQTSLSRQV